MKTILVDGATGFLGSRFLEHLGQTEGVSVIPVSQGKAKIDGCEYALEALGLKEIDVVVPFGSNTSLYRANQAPLSAVNSNLKMIEKLIFSLGIDVKKIVFPSSVTVYGVDPSMPVTERLPADPINFYDFQKIVSEQFLNLLHRRTGISVCTMRLANVYGFGSSIESSSDRGVLNQVVRNTTKGKTIKILGVGDCLRDYIHLDDVCTALLAACLSDTEGSKVFNVCYGESKSIWDVFNLVIKIGRHFGFTANLEVIEAPEGFDPSEFRNFMARPIALKEEFGWEPKISLESGIEQMFDLLKSKS